MKALAAGALILVAMASAAAADQCDGQANEIVAKMGATILHRTPEGRLLLAHPSIETLSIDCKDGHPTALAAFQRTKYPTPLFYEVASTATAAVFGVENARETVASCFSSALATGKEGHAISGRYKFTCGADEFGAGVVITP